MSPGWPVTEIITSNSFIFSGSKFSLSIPNTEYRSLSTFINFLPIKPFEPTTQIDPRSWMLDLSISSTARTAAGKNGESSLNPSTSLSGGICEIISVESGCGS